ncbi:MAG TPA: hypothetical protein VGO78_22265 [Acidimicrobiales bacterium]|jgi:hypothetical protein|nr:hypothetical protein [Acidimicrobiales bacterium]
MALRWSERDAFDESGARVATVARFLNTPVDADTFVWPTVRWYAFVAGEYVLVAGEPGRWDTESEAKAAAEAAYTALPPGAGAGFPAPSPGPQPSGFIGNARSLVHAWRATRRSPD